MTFLNKTNDEIEIKINNIRDDYYLTDKIIGHGVNGYIHLCINKIDNKQYACKALKSSLKTRREIDVHYEASMNCPNIVQIKDVYQNVIRNHVVYFLILEYMKGGDLLSYLIERCNSNKPFKEREVARMINQICCAVRCLHSLHIAHRDLKPENILLTSHDENATLKISDFGFAKHTDDGLYSPCFTPYYVAPEVLASVRYDLSCDIWSIGVILYILLCGYPPFYTEHGENFSIGMKERICEGDYEFPSEDWSNVSDEAKNLIKRMLDPCPATRININDVINNQWISQYSINVPERSLSTWRTLDKTKLPMYENAIEEALNEMRINWDDKIELKEFESVDSPLLQRRRKKQRLKQQNYLNKNISIF